MPLIQLAYYSRSLVRPDDDAALRVLREILTVSRINNRRDGITGYLLLDRTWFLQILEGDADRVGATFERIKGDSYHADPMVISRREIRARSFPVWAMGGNARTRETETIFERHGIGDPFDPRHLTAPSIVALALDLHDYERLRTRVPGPSVQPSSAGAREAG